MIRRPSSAAVLALTAALAAAGCSKIETAVKGAAARAAGPIDKAALDAAIDKNLGGPDTCVIMLDARSGAEAYRYGSNVACARELPPCSTFNIPATLIALDSGAATPASVFKWDHKPQAVSAWEHDTDMSTAFKQSVAWVFQNLAVTAGASAYETRLKAFGYGNHLAQGPIGAFWQGPQGGGELAISTRGQAEFLRRLYNGRLPAKPESTAFVTTAMVDEIRSGATMSGRLGSCPSNGDGSRQVGWWIGRLQAPKGDWVFAASIEGDNALPGLEVQTRIKDDFAKAGIWPAMS